MKHYFTRPTKVKLQEIKRKLSFASGDYRILKQRNNNCVILSSILDKEFKGLSTNSDNFVKKSPYRFIKTNNIGKNYLLDGRIIEYSKPLNNFKPQNGDILIAKDGASEGLGECVYYNEDNTSGRDTICAEILDIRIKNEIDKFYIMGLLKSQHFKDYIDLNTPKGSTLRHSKKIALNYNVCFPTLKNNKIPDKIVNVISGIIQSIINKEETIAVKYEQINTIIENELNSGVKGVSFIYNLPRLDEIKKEYRYDSGTYSEEFKKIIHLITNYKYGYFYLAEKDLKSGGTPIKRIFSDKGKFVWVTPSDISDNGCFTEITRISCHNNNLKKDAVIFINRTSKGKKGEFVGVSMFYDFTQFGLGHHNQGCYRLERYLKEDKIFVVAFFNSRITRKLCGNMCVGSKMKEMKINNFSKIPIPQFPDTIKNQIVKLYYNDVPNKIDIYKDEFLINEKSRNKNIGIFQLGQEIIKSKVMLEVLFDKIINNITIR